MQCTNPVTVAGQGVFRCGHCRACRIARAREWSVRLVHETEYHECSAFVTLTYDDQHLPPSLELNKAEYQRFMKRLRKRLPDRKLKYYACGEYGETYGRPHYHAIIYGVSLCGNCRCCNPDLRSRSVAPDSGSDCAAVEDSWGRGYVHLGFVSLDSARYVADYVQKDTRSAGSRTPQFSLQSQGLGLRWSQDNLDLRKTVRGLPRRGKLVAVPRYYQKKLIETYGILAPVAKWILRQQKLRYVWSSLKKRDASLFGVDRKDIGATIVTARRQSVRNVEAKERLKESSL